MEPVTDICIRCPDVERMPDAPRRTRLRREVRSAALPSLNPPERVDGGPFLPGKDGDEFQQRHLSAPAGRRPELSVKLPRTLNIRAKREGRASLLGPLQIHSTKLQAVKLPASPEPQDRVPTRGPALAPAVRSVPVTACPSLLRAAFRGERRTSRCRCSAAIMPSVTDLEYDAFVSGQPPHSQQMLVVCVTAPRRPDDVHAVPSRDPLEELYRRRNRHRTRPCSQCQMDSFRLLRYETWTGQPCCEAENVLLQQRHNAAPGMILMYIRGKLLFVGYTTSCSARDLKKQICKTRGNYRSGQSLPSDYKFSDGLNSPETKELHNLSTLTRGDEISVTASEDKETMAEKKSKHAPDASLR
ncbi:uncharacterized protein C3orf20 homolog isoform X2 [Salarias fasciatus]|uniref:uncharacterized protein C3orf20 homolog isoform X2 n=1 Tax=Salarias fasciatus TaxID=181472 RepID=UPI001176D5D9|nr:uncharacterized protein C3orf20 homolog isoform X2 [Salarias fasciatus]